MALIHLREEAIRLRKEGCTYTEIKTQLGLSKSTLSGWLKQYPLSEVQKERIRAQSHTRVENFRSTMLEKRNLRLKGVKQQVRADIGTLTKRELFIAGLFLYWAEGTKRAYYTTALANTDPSMIRFYISWLRELSVPEQKIAVRLQLYQDMDIAAETAWWSKQLHLPLQVFKNPYRKKNTRASLTYKGGFGHGTCNVLIHNRDLYEYVINGVYDLQRRYDGC